MGSFQPLKNFLRRLESVLTAIIKKVPKSFKICIFGTILVCYFILFVDNVNYWKSKYFETTSLYNYRLGGKWHHLIERDVLHIEVKFYQYLISSYWVICNCSSKIGKTCEQFFESLCIGFYYLKLYFTGSNPIQYGLIRVSSIPNSAGVKGSYY